MSDAEEYKVKYWKSKHRDALRELETQEGAFRSLEHILRRLVTRLCTAAAGADSRLDVELNRLSAANRRNAAAAELEVLFESLTKAVADMPDVPTSAVERATARAVAAASETAAAAAGTPSDAGTQPPADDGTESGPASTAATGGGAAASGSALATRWSATIAAVGALLGRLQQGETPQSAAHKLHDELAQVADDGALAGIVERAADLVRDRAERLAREKLEALALLTQVTRRLDEVAVFIASGNSDRRASFDEAENLNTQVLGQVRVLSDEVRIATDLGQLRGVIASRVDSISQQMQVFRQREEHRFLEHSARTDALSKKVAELTRQTRALEADLDKERQRARIDSLTGLANRAAFEERLAEEVSRWQRAPIPFAVLFWDIDHFKAINDNFGHAAGDRVLREVARCFQARLRASDFVARVGGEEFVALLAGTPPQGAMKVADDVRLSVAALRMHFRGTPVPVTVSCGVTELRAGDTTEIVIDRADSALYSAKKHGRNVCIAA
ncbi:MAG: GGDEF domain-containing protein [Steroidobacteraceae bacterium]